jgi:hypothetical protein
VALSSAEAEYVAVVMGIQEGLAIKSLLEELGYEANVTVTTDATAALAACAKRGLLRFKHLAIKWLFVKELVDRGTVVLEKVPTAANKADFLTKAVPAGTLVTNLGLIPSLILQKSDAEVNVLEKDDTEPESEACLPVAQLASLEPATLPTGAQNDSDRMSLMAFCSLTGGAAFCIAITAYEAQRWLRRCCSSGRKPVTPATRDVQVQAQCTYTSVQSSVQASRAQPRFQPLSEAQHGAWPQ